MKATIWHNPKCGTSRKTLQILTDAQDVEVQVIEYLKTGFDKEKLIQLFNDAQISPRQALRVRGSRAEELGLTEQNISDDAILNAMSEDSMLVERPLVESEKGVCLCRPQDKVYNIL